MSELATFEFVERSGQGRHFEREFIVQLGDASVTQLLRFDGIARFLQDIATDDWADTGIQSEATWVVRRTVISSTPSSWPAYQEQLRAVTWCGGYGAAWAERRTNFYRGDEVVLQAASLWVPIDRSARPMRLEPSFFDVYGEAMNGRKVSGRVVVPPVPNGAVERPWPLRQADLDVVGHVNNAAIWQAVTEVFPAPMSRATVVHQGSLEDGDDVVLVHQNHAIWLCVDEEIRVYAEMLP